MMTSGHIEVLCVTRECKRRVIVTLLSHVVQPSWQPSCQLSLSGSVDKTNGTKWKSCRRQCGAFTLTNARTHTHTKY